MQKEKVTEYIKDSIANGKFSPGQRLVETRVCRDLGVGRTAVREALRQLEQEFFVEIIPHRGAFLRRVSQRDVAQIFDLMGALEGLSMRVATPTISDSDVRKLEKLIEEMEASTDYRSTLFQAHAKFHQLLAALGGNGRLISIMNNLREQALAAGLQNFYNLEEVRESERKRRHDQFFAEQTKAAMREHRGILNAVRERNPSKVETTIRKHLHNSKNRLIRYINDTL